ncbi:DNA adenine methylase [Mycobacteroides abscessus]|uniref:DNA adenine methylase n=1 Tax=Mycobacteroides abscessus TaxID=36809 RepID=UPI0022A9D486|nr:DNA adenine methylase [Mycobacteroides abscessus]
MRWVSPLRYPGGKGRMAAALAELFAAQFGLMAVEIWIEPFAGGAGAGLHLLAQDVVEEIWLTEKNRALAAFWRTVVQNGAELSALIRACSPDMHTWHDAKGVVAAAEAGETINDLDLAFAALVINRCSRSGMVTTRVGPIGGKSQNGPDNIRARWNSAGLADRIDWIWARAERVRISEGDAAEHIAALDGSVGIEEEVLLFVDPPYLVQGNRLYAAGMSYDDHKNLAYALNNCGARWLLTYDSDERILDLYPANRVMAYEIPHTANQRRVEEEYAVLSDNLAVRDDQNLLPAGATRWVQHSPCGELDHDCTQWAPLGNFCFAQAK